MRAFQPLLITGLCTSISLFAAGASHAQAVAGASPAQAVAGASSAQAAAGAKDDKPVAPRRPPTPDVPTQTNQDPSFLRVYGFIKPTVIVASGAVDSYGRSNMSAILTAGNPVLAVLSGESRMTFQVQQSRFGLWFHEQESLRGQLEFDMIDPAFSKASPTTASYPRLRIAKIEYAFDKHHKVAFGQDWDIFSPLSPATFNIVGSLYLTGNAAFLRQQLSYSYVSDRLEAAAALGFEAPNNGAQDRGLELSKVPTLALRVGALFGKRGRVGVSAIGTELYLKPGEPVERRTLAYGGNLYAEAFPYEGLHLSAEAYVGQNLGNINQLTMAYGRAPTAVGQPVANIREAGFWVSLKHKLWSSFSGYVSAGTAHVLNPSKVIPNYSAAVPASATTAAVPAALGPDPLSGLRNNSSVRVGLSWKPLGALTLVAEGFFISTLHTLHADDLTRFAPRRTVFGTELGAMYTF